MTTPPPAARSNVRRLVVAGAIAVVVIVAFVVFVLPGLRRRARIDALSDRFDANHQALVADDDPGLQDALVERMEDSSHPFSNRVGAATVLLARDRIKIVEQALRTGSLDVRTVALAALRRHNSFAKQVAVDMAADVNRTLVEWLARPDDRSRKTALEIAIRLQPAEALPSIRALAVATGEPSDVRRTAVGALHAYRDCESAPALHRLVLSDSDASVRKQALQALEGLHGQRGGPCKTTLTEAMMREATAAALAHPGTGEDDRLLRQLAMISIRRTPSLAEGQTDVLRARLDPSATVAERREALETLAALKDEATIARLPRYVHDPEEGMRHSAVVAVTRTREPDAFRALAPLLVGYVRDERTRSGEATFEAALQRLRDDAGEWIGFPERRPESPAKRRPAERELLRAIYAGTAEGTTRERVADAWFRHHAKKAGLDPAGVDAAVAVRDSFWTKARANDVAGARALLEGDATVKGHPALFVYERGWLEARSPS